MRDKYAKPNEIGAGNPADWSMAGKPVLLVPWSTNAAWYLYSFWALFVLYEVQLDNKLHNAIKWYTCMGGGDFDNRADEKHLSRERENN